MALWTQLLQTSFDREASFLARWAARWRTVGHEMAKRLRESPHTSSVTVWMPGYLPVWFDLWAGPFIARRLIPRVPFLGRLTP